MTHDGKPFPIAMVSAGSTQSLLSFSRVLSYIHFSNRLLSRDY